MQPIDSQSVNWFWDVDAQVAGILKHRNRIKAIAESYYDSITFASAADATDCEDWAANCRRAAKFYKECLNKMINIGGNHELRTKIYMDALEWEARFIELDSIDDCTDMINRPHEDYPARVADTMIAIANTIDALPDVKEIKEFDILAIHSFVMKGLESRGAYRQKDVVIGSPFKPIYKPVEWFHVPQLMAEIMPVSAAFDIEVLKTWYKIFEKIHPFEDGNGRVGGIVVAAVSFSINGKYLTPCQ